MKKNNRYYIILAILLIYFVFIFFVFILPNILKKETKTYLLIDSDAKWQYINGKWSDIEDSKVYNWQKFAIYENSGFKGNYYPLYNEKWHFYDNDENPIKIDKYHFLGIKSNKKYQVATFNTEDISETYQKYIKEVLNKYKLSSTNFTNAKVIKYDLDGDEQEEKIYSISNVFVEEFTEKIFNFIFVVKDDKITIVSKSIDKYSNMLDNCQDMVSKIVDVDNDGNYELITSCYKYNINAPCTDGCADFGSIDACVEMYQKDKNGYKRIKKCN